ncbi:hypothetical protein PRUB_b0862 [Pseudoalteromonas rubra]|uniref:Uncharacterized protein n=1 Tax=Pseudoalteromonas rubra TaxID=43658 RepID=A0A8T0C0K5_9GAMM|nr:hypothetical protein PRUB_b0862 [Pseudoalteromonas rubra]
MFTLISTQFDDYQTQKRAGTIYAQPTPVLISYEVGTPRLLQSAS